MSKLHALTKLTFSTRKQQRFKNKPTTDSGMLKCVRTTKLWWELILRINAFRIEISTKYFSEISLITSSVWLRSKAHNPLRNSQSASGIRDSTHLAPAWGGAAHKKSRQSWPLRHLMHLRLRWPLRSERAHLRVSDIFRAQAQKIRETFQYGDTHLWSMYESLSLKDNNNNCYSFYISLYFLFLLIPILSIILP